MPVPSMVPATGYIITLNLYRLMEKVEGCIIAETDAMRISLFLMLALGLGNCQHLPAPVGEIPPPASLAYSPVPVRDSSWQHFLRHLPARHGVVVDYTGAPIANQDKHLAVVAYDIGRRDLQQCADALMRLRAEYLFGRKQYNQIAFHFTSGHLYTFKDYCSGLRPRTRSNGVAFISGASCDMNYRALRAYLDIVYMYAGTISLCRELKPASGFEIGTIIIKPGSPGHCCIIVDEARRRDGKKVYKLAEGYTPAQSIYILKNPADGSPWYELKEGEPVLTASYHFTRYYLKQF